MQTLSLTLELICPRNQKNIFRLVFVSYVFSILKSTAALLKKSLGKNYEWCATKVVHACSWNLSNKNRKHKLDTNKNKNPQILLIYICWNYVKNYWQGFIDKFTNLGKKLHHVHETFDTVFFRKINSWNCFRIN